VGASVVAGASSGGVEPRLVGGEPRTPAGSEACPTGVAGGALNGDELRGGGSKSAARLGPSGGAAWRRRRGGAEAPRFWGPAGTGREAERSGVGRTVGFNPMDTPRLNLGNGIPLCPTDSY
jgi:hypothetical protein